jgi:hypothetical protein
VYAGFAPPTSAMRNSQDEFRRIRTNDWVPVVVNAWWCCLNSCRGQVAISKSCLGQEIGVRLHAPPNSPRNFFGHDFVFYGDDRKSEPFDDTAQQDLLLTWCCRRPTAAAGPSTA